MAYDRTHSRLISDYGGLAKTMPLYAAMLVIFSLSSLGLPGTNSFVGEFLVLLGAFITYPVFAVVASLGIILAAVYMLWMFQRVAFGEANPKNARHPDLNLRELATVVPLAVVLDQGVPGALAGRLARVGGSLATNQTDGRCRGGPGMVGSGALRWFASRSLFKNGHLRRCRCASAPHVRALYAPVRCSRRLASDAFLRRPKTILGRSS
jgi:hypothetical protein